MFAWIDSDADTWDSVAHADDAAPEGFYAVEVPAYYPAGGQWSAIVGAFLPFVQPARALIPVGRFKLLLTRGERIGLRAAAAEDPDVFDALDLLNGFTNGISLDDPVLAAFLAQMVAKDLLASDRVATILSGEPA